MICLNCGCDNKEGTILCRNCGADILELDVRSARPGTAKWKKYVKLGYIHEYAELNLPHQQNAFEEEEFPEAHYSIFLDADQAQQITVSKDLYAGGAQELSLTRVRTGEVFRIDQDQTVFGKGSQAACRIDGNPAISRTHLNLFRQEGCVYVEDLHSSNHTYVDGRQIDAPVQVRDGSRIQMADEMFVLHIGEAKKPALTGSAGAAAPSGAGTSAGTQGRCAFCGGELSPGAKFCRNCGRRVE